MVLAERSADQSAPRMPRSALVDPMGWLQSQLRGGEAFFNKVWACFASGSSWLSCMPAAARLADEPQSMFSCGYISLQWTLEVWSWWHDGHLSLGCATGGQRSSVQSLQGAEGEAGQRRADEGMGSGPRAQ